MLCPIAERERLVQHMVDEAASLSASDPTHLLRVSQLCQDHRTDAREIALVVQRDAGFAAVLLRLANSAFYARTTPVGDIVGAIMRIGVGTVGTLALTTPGLRLLGPDDGLRHERRRLQRHAVRTGLAARQIAPPAQAELALAAGLVHNLGLTVMSLFQATAFASLLATAAAGAPLRDSEQELLGIGHAELGARVAAHWRYPEELVEAIARHDDESPSGLAAVVRYGDLLVREAGMGVEWPEPVPTELVDEVGVEVESARERVAPLFEAEGRLASGPADSQHEETTALARLAQSLDSLV